MTLVWIKLTINSKQTACVSPYLFNHVCWLTAGLALLYLSVILVLSIFCFSSRVSGKRGARVLLVIVQPIPSIHLGKTRRRKLLCSSTEVQWEDVAAVWGACIAYKNISSVTENDAGRSSSLMIPNEHTLRHSLWPSESEIGVRLHKSLKGITR